MLKFQRLARSLIADARSSHALQRSTRSTQGNMEIHIAGPDDRCARPASVVRAFCLCTPRSTGPRSALIQKLNDTHVNAHSWHVRTWPVRAEDADTLARSRNRAHTCLCTCTPSAAWRGLSAFSIALLALLHTLLHSRHRSLVSVHLLGRLIRSKPTCKRM